MSRYNWDLKARGEHLKTLGIPWAIRKVVNTFFKGEGRIVAIVRWVKGEYVERTYDLGILGTQVSSE